MNKDRKEGFPDRSKPAEKSITTQKLHPQAKQLGEARLVNKSKSTQRPKPITEKRSPSIRQDAELNPSSADGISPEKSLEALETNTNFQAAVASLPEEEKAIIVGYYHARQSMAQLAESLGLSTSEISQLHARALKLLSGSMMDE